MARLLNHPKALFAALLLVGALAATVTVGILAQSNAPTGKSGEPKTDDPAANSKNTPAKTAGKSPGKGAGKSGGGSGRPMPPALVRVASAKVRQLRQQWEVIGRLKEQRRTIVAAEQMGKFVEVNFFEGTAVTAPPPSSSAGLFSGSPTGSLADSTTKATPTTQVKTIDPKFVLARIDDVWIRLSMVSAQAKIKEASAKVKAAQDGVTVAEADVLITKGEVEQAQRDVVYLQDLVTAGSAKPKEVKDSQTQLNIRKAGQQRAEAKVVEAQAFVASAQAQVALAESELNRLHTQMQRLVITAPFDGIVVKKLAEVGQWAAQGTPVAEIISRGRIDALIDVPERFINRLDTKTEVAVLIEPLKLQTTGRVRSIIPIGSSAARSYPVKVSLDDLGGKLKPGMSVTALIPTTESKALLTVPRDCLQRSARGAVVWIAHEGKAFRVPVKVLFIADKDYAIEVAPNHEGPPLVDRTVVIIEGGEKLMFPGQPIKVVGK